MHYDAREPKKNKWGHIANDDKISTSPYLWHWLIGGGQRNTFHLLCGEMTITLQDVSMLTGLPLVGQAIVLPDSPEDWRDDIVRCAICPTMSRSTN